MTKKITKEARMDQIIDAAIEEFLSKGYAGSSMDSIANRAGVSKGGVYHHFPNKEVLLMESNRKLSQDMEEIAMTVYKMKDPIQGLSFYIREYILYWTGHLRELSFFFFSMSKSFESEILMEYYQEYSRETEQFLTGMFERIKSETKDFQKDPHIMGITLMGAMDGLLTYLVMNPENNLDYFIEEFTRFWVEQR